MYLQREYFKNTFFSGQTGKLKIILHETEQSTIVQLTADKLPNYGYIDFSREGSYQKIKCVVNNIVQIHPLENS